MLIASQLQLFQVSFPLDREHCGSSIHVYLWQALSCSLKASTNSNNRQLSQAANLLEACNPPLQPMTTLLTESRTEKEHKNVGSELLRTVDAIVLQQILRQVPQTKKLDASRQLT